MGEDFKDIDTGPVSAIKSGALRQLDEFAEAAELLAEYIDPDDCDSLDCPLNILTEAIFQVEHLRSDTAEYSKYISKCQKLAMHCMNCQNEVFKDQSALVLAELMVLSAGSDTQQLGRAEQLLLGIDTELYRLNTDYLRTKARLLTAGEEFYAAAMLWNKIAKLTSSQKHQSQYANIQWWQAKYYSILCFSKLAKTTDDQTNRAIDVLVDSGSDIPPFWAEKLSQLKKLD
jgi:hypothetical protein